jgi:hypothetical protein
MKKALLLTALTLSLLACAALIQPTPVPISTHVSPAASSTTIPTLSPAPAPTTTAAPTPWPTFPVLLSSPFPTPTATLALDCHLNWQSPRNGVTYKPGDSFTTGWKVTNTGAAVWYPGSVDFTYLAGAKLYDNPVVRLPASVPPGQTLVLSVAMTAPKNPTMYTTRWSLRKGPDYFCPLSLSIYVQ